MPVTTGHLQVAIRGLYLGQQVEVVQWYRLNGAAFLTATVLGVLEAYWNNIKDDWRAFHINGADDRTISLFGREPGTGGAYAEFPIPTGERQGTRDGAVLGDWMPPMNATGIKLVVGSGVTRPGAKRLWGMVEGDQNKGALGAGIVAAANVAATIFANTIILGSPVATGEMQGEIVRLDPDTGLVSASQDVTGFIVKPNVTTQNSRKIGRGA